jgi:hypothetical protein
MKRDTPKMKLAKAIGRYRKGRTTANRERLLKEANHCIYSYSSTFAPEAVLAKLKTLEEHRFYIGRDQHRRPVIVYR